MTVEGLPDYEQVAARLDRWLPHIAPVTNIMLRRLPVSANTRILDIACGTGEPGLSLARNWLPEVEIVGVDAAQAMVQVSQQKAARENLNNITFQVMRAEKLEFANGSFDGVLSRFGLMLLSHPKAGCEEMLRVLKPGGNYSVAIWDQIEWNTVFFAIAQTLNWRVSDAVKLPLKQVQSLAGDTVLLNLLQECGARDVATELFTFEMKFPSFEELWSLVQESGIYDAQLNSLSVEDRFIVREQLEHLLSQFKQADCYVIPHTCRLAWGTR